jgi:putative membrane protein
LYGSIFGFGSPVPGVSAGTVAIMLNVYDWFFSTITFKTARKYAAGIVFFLLGWAVGLLGIAQLVMFLFENHGQIMSFIFIGLILGCVPMIYEKAGEKRVSLKNIFLCVLAFGFMVFLTLFAEDLAANDTLEAIGGATPANLAWIFFASFVASMAMLIPGVGGSLMMLVFGIYTIYIESVASLDFLVIAVFITSMILGVLAGIFITKKMLEKFSQTLYCVILGLVVGSILFLFPGVALDLDTALALSWGAVCFIFTYWLSTR